jgi:hypothetical protein
MSHATKCSSVTFWKIYLVLLGCVVFKTFAFLGICDHVYSFMAIVHIVCLLDSHEWKYASQVHNSQNSHLLSIPWIISMKILILWISSNQVWAKLIQKDSILILMTKVESWRSLFGKILSIFLKKIIFSRLVLSSRWKSLSPKRLKWKDIIIIKSSQGQNCDENKFGNF